MRFTAELCTADLHLTKGLRLSSAHIPFSEAVHAQPTNLVTAIEHIERSLAATHLPQWLPGDTVAVLGMGASTNSAHALASALSSHGVRVANVTASELADAPASFEPGDHYLLVTESGRSPEPLEAARSRGEGRRIAITNFPEAAISKVADYVISYGGVDDSAVYTTGYLATLASYAALTARMGFGSGLELSHVPALVADTLDSFTSVATELAPFFEGARAIDLIGHGFGYCSATQGALMFREGLRIPAAGTETYQFIHGPIESADADTLLIVIGNGRELEVAQQLAQVGTNIIVLTAAPAERLTGLTGDNVHTISLAHTTPGFERTIAETVVLQLLTEAAAARLDIKIEEFLYNQPDIKLPDLMGAAA